MSLRQWRVKTEVYILDTYSLFYVPNIILEFSIERALEIEKDTVFAIFYYSLVSSPCEKVK